TLTSASCHNQTWLLMMLDAHFARLIGFPCAGERDADWDLPSRAFCFKRRQRKMDQTGGYGFAHTAVPSGA
ncbi:MAG TPA: hypothetical protein DCL72_06170, partial [Rhizobiales bacterium]|nr:hypothetical protein [Hyphomicrobiales bacterium]